MEVKDGRDAFIKVFEPNQLSDQLKDTLDKLQKKSQEKLESVGVIKENNPLNVQVGGGHYKDMGIQPVQYAHANKLDFFQGSVIKYITRFRSKNGLQDLQKAKHFIDLLIELEYPNKESK